MSSTRLIVSLTLCLAAVPRTQAADEAPAVPARACTVPIVSGAGVVAVDGRLDEPAWARAGVETNFSLPWEPTAPQRTEFRIVRDGVNLYFAFTVTDETPIIAAAYAGERTLDDEDRVELFFCRDAQTNNYYCIEIDLKGRVHDYASTFSRRQFDSAWTCEGLKTSAQAAGATYTIEASIPLRILADLGIPVPGSGAPIVAGLFRADLYRDGEGKIVPHWIAWVDPKVPRPNFHTRSAFGRFVGGK